MGLDRTLSLRLLLSAPAMVGAGIVLGDFAATPGAIGTVSRVFLGVVVTTLVVQVALTFALHRTDRAALATLAILLLLIGRDLTLPLMAVAAGGAAMQLWRRMHGHPVYKLPLDSLLVLPVAFLLVSGGQVLLSGAVTWDDIRLLPPSVGQTGEPGPNIYFLLLDGYARQDTLAGMGFDNGPFLARLEARGFDVYRDSRSNYNFTGPTLTSIFNLKPLAALALPKGDETDDRRVLRRAINAGTALTILRQHGYRLVTMQPIADHAALYAVDEVRASSGLNQYEIHFLQDTTLAGILSLIAPDYVAGQHRDRIRAAFAALQPESVATFTWMHVVAPHPPFVFNADGSAKSLPACFPRCWFWAPWNGVFADDFEANYTAQVRWVNTATLAAVDRVIAGDPQAVMVIFGDHGSRATGDTAEYFRNLLAVRSPAFPRLLGTAPTMVNVLPAIFNAYLGTDLRRWPDEQFTGKGISDQEPYGPVR
jgi:hypothetical protein